MKDNATSLAWAKADQENGCEHCWDALRADLCAVGLPDPAIGTVFVVPSAWIGRICTHDAPAHAETILLAENLICGTCYEPTAPTIKEAALAVTGALFDGGGYYHCMPCCTNGLGL